MACDNACGCHTIYIRTHCGQLDGGGGSHARYSLFAGNRLDEGENRGYRGSYGLKGYEGALPAGRVDDSGGLEKRGVHLLLEDDDLRLHLSEDGRRWIGEIGFGLRDKQVGGGVEAGGGRGEDGRVAGVELRGGGIEGGDGGLQGGRPVDDVFGDCGLRAARNQGELEKQGDEHPDAETGMSDAGGGASRLGRVQLTSGIT